MSCVFPNVNEQTATSVVLYKHCAVAELLWKGFSACGRLGTSVEDWVRSLPIFGQSLHTVYR